jgi:hypothetical protein
MNKQPRCQQMLENHTQCPNDSVPPSLYCKLHIALEEGKNSQTENKPNSEG